VDLLFNLSTVLWLKAGVFNISDSAGHINNFNDARGPQTYDVHVHVIWKSGRSVNLTTNRYIMCRQRAGLAFVVSFSKRPAGHIWPAGHALKTPGLRERPLLQHDDSKTISHAGNVFFCFSFCFVLSCFLKGSKVQTSHVCSSPESTFEDEGEYGGMALSGTNRSTGRKTSAYKKIRDPTSQKTQSDPATKTKRLMLFREIIALILNKTELTTECWLSVKFQD
jgi:hypothetical protein